MKTFSNFITEAAKIVGHVDVTSFGPRKKRSGYTSPNKPKKKELSYTPEVSKAFDDLNAIVEAQGAIIDEVGFRGHLAKRVSERSLFKNILRLFEKLKKTKFYKDLKNNNKEYMKDRNRKYGPQLVDEGTKTHVGTEIIKKGGKLSIVVKSVMGDFTKDYMNNIRKHSSKPRFYFVR